MSAEDQADLAKRLKRILSDVRRRKDGLAEFRHNIEMVSRNEVEKVVEEFRQFLLKKLESPDGGRTRHQVNFSLLRTFLNGG